MAIPQHDQTHDDAAASARSLASPAGKILARPLAPAFLFRLPAPSRSVLVVSLGGESLLGRSTRCALVLAHPSVSRRHALLSVVGDGLRVTDLTSKNGTFVNAVRVAGTAVAVLGSRLCFGGVEFITAAHEGGEKPDSSRDTDLPTTPGQRQARKAACDQLSAAQQRVFRLLLEGMPEKRIAARLRISTATAHNHVTAIYRAFRVHSRAELRVRALS